MVEGTNCDCPLYTSNKTGNQTYGVLLGFDVDSLVGGYKRWGRMYCIHLQFPLESWWLRSASIGTLRRDCYPTPIPDWRKFNPVSPDIPFLAAFTVILSSHTRLALWSSLLFSGSSFIRISHLPHSVYIHYLFHCSWLDRPNTVLWTVPITKPK